MVKVLDYTYIILVGFGRLCFRISFSDNLFSLYTTFINKSDLGLFQVNNRYTRARCEICSKLTIKTPERRFVSGVFIVNFEDIPHLVLVFLWLTLSS